MTNGETEITRKVMVISDPTRESAAALQYTLSHVVVEQDELILLHVGNTFSWRSTFSSFLKRPTHPSSPSSTSPKEILKKPVHLLWPSSMPNTSSPKGFVGDVNFLEEMKHACEVAHPKVPVQVEKVEMGVRKDKATTIIAQCKELSVDLLVIGQRRNLSAAILGSRRNGVSTKGIRTIDTAEYLIENSHCTCVGVQKKGQNAGYLLNTKTHKNFWLLA